MINSFNFVLHALIRISKIENKEVQNVIRADQAKIVV